MPNRPASVLAALILAPAVPALAQPASASATPPAPSTTLAPVTVQSAANPKVIEKQAHAFVQGYAAPTARLGQFARWRDAVCVQVLGLVPDQAARVAARTEEVAKAVGLTVRPPGCRSNIDVVFTGRPQRLLDAMVRRYDGFLGFHYPAQTKALATVTRPIQAWYKTATRGGAGPNAGIAFAYFRDANGTPVTGGYPGATIEEETVDDPDNGAPTGCADSHFSSCLESVFKNVLVVVDSGRMEGHTLGPVSDYVAMLALSQPRSLDGCGALPSVIDLFAQPACPGRDAPDGLTPADAAYLTSLYEADLEAKGASERSDITGRMAHILVKASAPARAPK